MKAFASFGVLVVPLVLVSAVLVSAQQPAPPPQSDKTQVTHLKASDFPGLLAKMPNDRTGLQRVFSQAPYNINVERRLASPPAPAQTAFIHKLNTEVFYVLEGSATMTTGGTLVTPKSIENDTSINGTAIEGGATREMAKGDLVVVPAGIPHWFSKINESITFMQLYLPAAEK